MSSFGFGSQCVSSIANLKFRARGACGRQPNSHCSATGCFGNLSFGFRHGIHHKLAFFCHGVTTVGSPAPGPLDVSVCKAHKTNHSVRFRDDDPTDLASGSIPIPTTKQDMYQDGSIRPSDSAGSFVGLPACRSINHRCRSWELTIHPASTSRRFAVSVARRINMEVPI